MTPFEGLRAGAARVDITPDIGIQLAGDIGRCRPVEEIRERLYVNALVVEFDRQRLCLLSMDLLAIGCDWSDRIRHEVSARSGMPPEAVMVHVLQNHAAPTIGHLFVVGRATRFPDKYPWLKGGDERFNEPVVAACATAAERAAANLEPVVLSVGHGVDGRVAFNRRFIMRDGTARCHPPVCDPQILHVEGPADPEVAVASFTNRNGRVIAALLHHTCHPCHGYPHRYVIGDWPGAWSARMREHWGTDCVPLVVNGCCGNIHHTDHTSPSAPRGHMAMADLLTETTLKIIDPMETVAVDTVAWRRFILPLQLRESTPADLAEAASLLERHPEPIWLDEARTCVAWDWVYAVNVLDLADLRRQQPVFDYEIQAFRIGEIALVGLMGEPFVEGQLEIKLRSPTRHTFVAHFCNGYAGYVPTLRAFAGGGYETRTGVGSKLPPDALDRVTAAASIELEELFAPRK